MDVYVEARTEVQQAERQLLAADLVAQFTAAGHEARAVRLGVYPGVALWCSGGASTVVLIDEDVIQWGRRWQHLARWRERAPEQLAGQVTATLTRRKAPASSVPGELP